MEESWVLYTPIFITGYYTLSPVIIEVENHLIERKLLLEGRHGDHLIGFCPGSRVVIPLIFPKVPQSSQTESVGVPQLPYNGCLIGIYWDPCNGL